MSVFSRTANRINLAFWGLLETLGFAFKVTGILALLAGFVVISEQALNYMRTDYWPSESLLWALPGSVRASITNVGDLVGVSGQIMDFLARVPLTLALLLAGVCLFLVGRILARDR